MMNRQAVAFPLVILGLISGISIASASEERPTVVILAEGYVRPIEGREFLPGARPDGARNIASTIALVRAPGVVLLVDPGMHGDASELVQALAREGVAPEDVTHIFISHHHPDHLTQVGRFSNATLVDFWATYKDDLWSDHADPFEIAPGIRVHRTPGHTAEDASLEVSTAAGTYVFTHLWWGPGKTPEQDPLASDADLLGRSREKIEAIADWIVPGHGAAFGNERASPAR